MSIELKINKSLVPVTVTMSYYKLEDLVNFLSSDSVKVACENNITLKIFSTEIIDEFQIVKKQIGGL
jgi:hypothetical protein